MCQYHNHRKEEILSRLPVSKIPTQFGPTLGASAAMRQYHNHRKEQILSRLPPLPPKLPHNVFANSLSLLVIHSAGSASASCGFQNGLLALTRWDFSGFGAVAYRLRGGFLDIRYYETN